MRLSHAFAGKAEQVGRAVLRDGAAVQSRGVVHTVARNAHLWVWALHVPAGIQLIGDALSSSAVLSPLAVDVAAGVVTVW